MRWLFLGLAFAACTPNWSPASVVDSLRVIGVRAEPPEIRPGQTAQLQQLIINPGGGPTTTLWLGCDPDPFGEGRGACSDVTALSDASQLVNTSALPEGVKLVGFNDQAAYSVASTLFDVLAADDPRRVTGTVGLIVSIAVAEEISPAATSAELSAVAGRVRDGTTASQLTLFRVAVSENPNPNHNPIVDLMTVNLQDVWPGQTAMIEPVIDNPIDLAAHDYEAYDEVTPSGVQHNTENIVASWYTTTGRFTEDRVALLSAVKSKLTGPGSDPDDLVPVDRRGTLWAVLRDSRGGQVWQSWPLWVCEHTGPIARVTAAEANGGTLVLHGDELTQVIDAAVGGVLVTGSFHGDTGTWQGPLPALPAGTYNVDVTSKSCARYRDSVTLP
jgi:hypothetical protein